MYQLAAEIITGIKTESYQSQAMINGLEREEETLSAFSFITNLDIKRVSVIKGDVPRTHCSPDSLLANESAGVEVKSPLAHTQIRYIDEDRLPLEYVAQVQYSMWITGYEYWYFFSYYPGIKPLLLKVERDEEYIKNLAAKTKLFLEDLEKLVEKMA